MELNKENIKKIIGIISFGIILYVGLENFESVKNVFSSILDVLSPFLHGIGLAFILNIIMSMFERKLFKTKKTKDGKIKKNKLKRPVCILLSFILVIFIISLIVKLVIPELINVIVMFAKDIPGVAYNLKEWAIELTRQYPDISNQISSIEINWEQLTNDMIGFLKSLIGSVVTSSLGFASYLVGSIFNAIITMVFTIYILNSKEKLIEQFTKIIKSYFSDEKAKEILKICVLSKNTFNNFITGQCLEAIILGTLCCIGMLILGIPYAVTISVLIGALALIPIVGAFTGLFIGLILIVSVSPIKALIFIIFFIILQQFENNVIYPRVVGESVGLPGMWVLFAVTVGGSLAGIVGLLIGLPTVSVLYTIFGNNVNKRLDEKKKAKKENVC